MSLPARILIGAASAATVAMLAHRARALSLTGAVAAVVTGTVAVAAGWDWATILICYFVGSSLLSRLHRRTGNPAAGIVTKAGPRDAVQVMANGSVFVLGALALVVTGGPGVIWKALAAGALAASAADTWATEIGTSVGQRPRSIVGWRPLAVGESGGVTIAGTIASVGGACFIAGVAAAVGWPRSFVLPIIIGGIGGALLDSVAGATIQRRSWCDVCHRATEMRTHTCGTQTRMTSGLSWLENDAVNVAATVGGALIAAALVPESPMR